jgi:hypothetical protein
MATSLGAVDSQMRAAAPNTRDARQGRRERRLRRDHGHRQAVLPLEQTADASAAFVDGTIGEIILMTD